MSMKKNQELTIINDIEDNICDCSVINIGGKSYDKLNYEFFNNFESAHTKKSYYNDISQFFDFIEKTFFKRLDDIERVHVVAYKNFLSTAEINCAPKTINRKLSSISSYFKFLVEKGVLESNPVTCIRRPKQSVRTPTNDIDDDGIRKMLEAVDLKSNSGPLHHAILYVLFTTGIRKSELINLKLKDYKKINNHHVIEIKGKGGKQLIKILHPVCVEVIESYLSWMRANNRNVLENDWLFMPTRNPLESSTLEKRINPKTIDYIIKKYAKQCGIFQRISPHSARASYIGSALESGVDIYKVSQDVGHSSVKTTEEYNKRKRRFEDSPVHSLGFLKNTG